jgi:SAM-dependent methyltransferase
MDSKVIVNKIDESEEYWDKRAKDFNKSINTENRKNRIKNLIEVLTNKGMINSQSTILDIGCGPGHISCELAKISKMVVGIDISENMLNYANENLKAQNLDNVEFLKVSWDSINLSDYNWEKKFDLVIANMCPAINSNKEIEKMIKASNNYCFISSFVQRNNSIHDEILQKLKIDNKNKYKNNIYSKFSYIWDSEMYPNIEYQDGNWENKYTIEEALDKYVFEANRKKELTKDEIGFIENIIKQKEDNGLVTEITKSKIARIYWNVNNI